MDWAALQTRSLTAPIVPQGAPSPLCPTALPLRGLTHSHPTPTHHPSLSVRPAQCGTRRTHPTLTRTRTSPSCRPSPTCRGATRSRTFEACALCGRSGGLHCRKGPAVLATAAQAHVHSTYHMGLPKDRCSQMLSARRSHASTRRSKSLPQNEPRENSDPLPTRILSNDVPFRNRSPRTSRCGGTCGTLPEGTGHGRGERAGRAAGTGGTVHALTVLRPCSAHARSRSAPTAASSAPRCAAWATSRAT